MSGLSVITLILILTGCPLSHDFPIDEPSVNVDPQLYGKYRDENGKSNFDQMPSTLIIGAGTIYSYSVTESYSTLDSVGNTVPVRNEYTAHISKVKGINFVNVCEKGKTLYWFYKVEVKGSDLHITEVSCFGYGDDWVSENSKELKTFLTKYINDKRLYAGTFDLIRQ